MAKQNFRMEWDAHEYEHKERSSDWFWAVGIITLSLALVSIIFGNIILAILLVLSVFTLTLFINRPPETIHVILDQDGITRGKVRYPLTTLHSFWIDENHPHRKILLRSQKLLMPLIVIPLGETDEERVRANLLKILPEEFLKLPLVEEVLEYFGF